MEQLNGAQQVVRVLEDLGVTRIFGYPGAAVTDIYDELYDSKKVVHTLARHEQGQFTWLTVMPELQVT